MGRISALLVALCLLFDACYGGDCQCHRNPNMFFQNIVSSQLLDLVNAYLPPAGPPRSDLITSTTNPNIIFVGDGSITLTFVSEGAANRNQLGVFTYDLVGGQAIIRSQELVFPDASFDQGCLASGDSVKVGPFSKGDNVGFYLVSNGDCTPQLTMYTVDSLNVGGYRQFAIFRDPVTQYIVLGIEDTLLPDGDGDYNDAVFMIEVDGNIDDSGIPDVCLPECPVGSDCVKARDGTLSCVPHETEEPFHCGDGSTTKQPFGDVASLFNVLVLDGFNCKYSDTEGRLAAGGTVDLEAYSVGCQVFNPNKSKNCINFGDVTCAQIAASGEWEHTLVSDARVNWLNGELKAGDLTYTTTVALSNVHLVDDCNAEQESVIDFSVQQQLLQGVSDAVKGATTTGTVVDDYGSLVLQGTQADVEVFALTADQLGGAHGLTFKNIKSGGTVLINVSGKTVAAGNFGFFDADPSRTLWNFFEATSLTFQNIEWEGSVLAIGADIIEPTGQLNGQVFAKSWQGSKTGTCMQLNNAPFQGCVPNEEGGHTPPPPSFGCIDDCLEELPGAANYNGYFQTDYQCVNSDVEGRLAAGGDLILQNMGFAACLLLDHTSDDTCVSYENCNDLAGSVRQTVVAGGNIVGGSSAAKVGDVVYGDTESNMFANGANCNLVKQANLINFNDAFSKLSQLCTDLNGLSATGTTTNSFGSITFTGAGNLDREVFDISTSDLNQANGVSLSNIKSGATIVINVHGTSVNAGNFGFNGNWPSRKVIWTFCDAATITVYGVGWKGTMLAPNSEFYHAAGQIDGQVIGKSWIGGSDACMELHEKPFNGCLPCF